jgi:hypothetical protein
MCSRYGRRVGRGMTDARSIVSRYATQHKGAIMDAGDMQERLHRYLSNLVKSGPVTKDEILQALADDNDTAIRTMVTEYIADGSYRDLHHALLRIPEEAWQAVQGDVWRGGDIGEETDSGFDDSKVAKMESKGGKAAGGKQAGGSTDSKNRKASGSRDAGMPGDGAGRVEDTQSQHSGVWPASGPLPDDPDARYQDMNSFGQGERGAAGYQDHGRSEVRTIPPEGEGSASGKSSTGNGSSR